MRNVFIVVVLLCAGALSWAQSSSQAAPAAKPPVHHPAAAGAPTAIIDTTVGKMTCTLFPDKAPIGVANFIGLATGTNDWTTVKGVTKHGVPLYDGTIFHRVIPGFMTVSYTHLDVYKRQESDSLASEVAFTSGAGTYLLFP